VLALILAGVYFIPRWLVPGYTANYVEIADFKNLMDKSGDADYFSAGITAAVRSQLADMRDVYIVDPKEGVHAPVGLEGSVQRLGDNLRISYRLFRRKDNVQIAGGKLDGTYQDIFILQDRLVGEIARYLAEEFDLQNFRPAPLRLTGDVTAYDYYLQGLDFLRKPSFQDNLDSAIQRFNQSLVHDENFVLAYVGLCDTYRLKYEITRSVNWVEDAERFCLVALRQDNSSAKAYESIGTLYRELGKYEEAIKFLNISRDKVSDTASVLIALARTYDLMQDDAGSESLYGQAIKVDSKNWRVFQEYGYFLARKGRYSDAIMNFNAALELTPGNATTLSNIGAVYLYMGEFKKAAQALEKATQIEPQAVSFFNTGSMYYFYGDFEKAVYFYKEALRMQPNDLEFLVNIADAYKFIPGGKHISDSYYKKAQLQADLEISSKLGRISSYQFASLAYVHFGDFEKAKLMMSLADSMEPQNIVSHYVHLRISTLEGDDFSMRNYVEKLVSGGYSEKLILSDPYFYVLKEQRFKDVFNSKL
jgi:adenylate cyclase